MKTFLKLRIRMLEKDIPQADVGEKAGISEGTMSSRMNGKSPFKVNEILAIAKILEIEPEEYYDYFFAEANRKKRKPKAKA